MPITSKAILDAQPGDLLRDDQVPGLHLRVFAGRKAFYLYFRTKEGRERRPKVGDYGVLTLDQARRAARDMLTVVALGRDPMAERRTARDAPTMDDLCTDYISKYAVGKKVRSMLEDKRQIDNHIKPRLGTRKVHSIKLADIDALHRSLKDTPYQANRVLALLSCMFNLAEKWEWRAPHTNPCRHVDRYTERKRKRYMLAGEAPKIAALLASQEADRPQAVAFIYILILSGARPEEISRARPEWIEPRGAGGVLKLPDSKTGDRPVYLPPQVMALISRLPPSRGTLLGIKSPKALWTWVRKASGIPDLRMYDLRHTFASAALKAGYSLDQIGELLGHANTQTTKRYAHLVDDAAQMAVAGTATLLEQMMSLPTVEHVGPEVEGGDAHDEPTELAGSQLQKELGVLNTERVDGRSRQDEHDERDHHKDRQDSPGDAAHGGFFAQRLL